MDKITGPLLALLFICGWIAYFIPTFIAIYRKCQKINGIALLNIFLGWSFLGWVAAIIWAVTDKKINEETKFNKSWLYIIIGCAIFGMILTYGGYSFVYNKSHPDYENVEPAFNVTAQDLYQAYKTNKEVAAVKYNGKMVALTGKLSKVETADSLVTAVFVFTQGDFGDEGIRCTVLKKFNDAADKLQPDGEVKLKGYCTGYNETDVILEKCSIINQ